MRSVCCGCQNCPHILYQWVLRWSYSYVVCELFLAAALLTETAEAGTVWGRTNQSFHNVHCFYLFRPKINFVHKLVPVHNWGRLFKFYWKNAEMWMSNKLSNTIQGDYFFNSGWIFTHEVLWSLKWLYRTLSRFLMWINQRCITNNKTLSYNHVHSDKYGDPFMFISPEWIIVLPSKWHHKVKTSDETWWYKLA